MTRKIKARRIEWCFGAFRHHGRYKIRQVLLKHADRSQQTGNPLIGQLEYPRFFLSLATERAVKDLQRAASIASKG
jgi:hypothetical protein